MYLWVHASLALMGIAFAVRPQIAGPLSPGSSGLLGLALTFGSALALIGSAIGSDWFLPQVHDVRVPYTVAGFGQLSVVAGLLSFAWVVAEHSADVLAALSAALAVGISGGCLHVTWRFIADVYKRSQVLAEIRHDNP
jgi:hypothetical protein